MSAKTKPVSTETESIEDLKKRICELESVIVDMNYNSEQTCTIVEGLIITATYAMQVPDFYRNIETLLALFEQIKFNVQGESEYIYNLALSVNCEGEYDPTSKLNLMRDAYDHYKNKLRADHGK